MTDYFTRAGAKKLANGIRQYYARRGEHVDVEVIPFNHNGETLFAVRSNLRFDWTKI